MAQQFPGSMRGSVCQFRIYDCCCQIRCRMSGLRFFFCRQEGLLETGSEVRYQAVSLSWWVLNSDGGAGLYFELPALL